MRQRKISLHPYLEQSLLEQIHAAVGVEIPIDEETAKSLNHEDIIEEDVVGEDLINRK